MDAATESQEKELQRISKGLQHVTKGIETAVTGVDTLQEGAAQHWEKLCEVQAQQLNKDEVATVMRHLEEVVDALHGLQAPVAAPVRRWPWWVHPSCYTLAVVLGIAVGLAALRWRPVQALVWSPPVAQAAPPAQKGKR